MFFFFQLFVWCIGTWIMYTVIKYSYPIFSRYLPMFLGIKKNWVHIVATAFNVMFIITCLRVIVPMSGLDMGQFDIFVGIFLGSFNFGLRSFIGNIVAYFYILYDGHIQEGHEILCPIPGVGYQFMTISKLNSQFIELGGKMGDDTIKILLPLDQVLSVQTIMRVASR